LLHRGWCPTNLGRDPKNNRRAIENKPCLVWCPHHSRQFKLKNTYICAMITNTEEIGLELDLGSLSGLNSLISLLSSVEVEKLAKSSGLVCRSSSLLTGAAFLRSQSEFIACGLDWSLSDQCDYLADNFGIEMTKQSLDKRFHTHSVSFMKTCYELIFSKIFRKEVGLSKHTFSHVLLSDSTTISLPSSLSTFYRSHSNKTSVSSVKINQTIDLQQFRIMDLQIWEGCQSDNNYKPSKSVEWGTNNLWLKDLGFYSSQTFIEIDNAGDYFLSRYKTNTNLYIKNGDGKYEVLDLVKHLESLSGKKGFSSRAIYIGANKQKISGRLICELVPDSVKEQRIAQYKASYKKQNMSNPKWEMTTLKILLCGYNLFITNTTQEQISDKLVLEVYALRWQIELLFKIWKSLLFMDQIGQINVFRFECFLYGRLIFLLLCTEIMAFVRTSIADSELDIEISEWKTMKILKKKCL